MSLSDLLGRAHAALAARFEEAPSAPNLLFFSFTDGTSRCRTIRAAGSNFTQAWRNGAAGCQSEAQRHNVDARWLRVDWVVETQATTWKELGARLARTKRNYFRMGVALDPELRFAFLEPELNANAMLYLGADKTEAGVNIKNFTVAAQRRFGKALTLDFSPETPVYVFAHEGLFVSDDPALAALPDAGEPNWLPGTPTRLGWRNPVSLNAGRRQIEQLTPEHVHALIDSSANFLTRQVQKNGQFVYGHFPCFGRLIPTYNTLRHASSVYSMLEAWELTRNDTLLAAARRALDYLTEKIIRRYQQPDGGWLAYNVDVNDEIKLGANAVSLLALVKYDELTQDTRYRGLMEELARGIARMQDPGTGRLVHVLKAEDLSVKEDFRIVYYDGEAAFGLMRLYGLTRDPRWLAIVEKSFDYFIANDHWKHHDHWLSYCANELTLHKPEEKYFRFGVQNVAGYLDFILKRETTYPTLLELSMAFEAMLRRINNEHPEMRHVLEGLDIDKFHQALHHRAHYLLNGFFWPELAMYFAKPQTVVGSFFIRHHTFRVRIDDIEHYLSGYVAYWKMLTRNTDDGGRKNRAAEIAGGLPADSSLPEIHTNTADTHTVGLLMYPATPNNFGEVRAYTHKAVNQGLRIVYLSYRNPYIEGGKVAGFQYQRGKWLPGLYRVPAIIDNAPPRNATERAWFERLRQMSYMTCNKLGPKDVTLSLLAADARTQPYVIQSAALSQANVQQFLNEYGSAVIKPVRSNRGRDVFVLRRLADGHIAAVTPEGQRLMDEAALHDFLHSRNESAWLLQRYIPSVDPQGRAFDIRVALFRAAYGEWRIARSYARVGANPVTSNLATGGTTQDAGEFLATLYPLQQVEPLTQRLQTVAKEIAEILQSRYDFTIDALGCDFGVADGEIHLFEVNAYPGIKGCLQSATDAKLAFHLSLLEQAEANSSPPFVNTRSVLDALKKGTSSMGDTMPHHLSAGQRFQESGQSVFPMVEISWPKCLQNQHNGRVDDALLENIRGGRLLRPAAKKWNEMRQAAWKEGVVLTPTSSLSTYRTLPEQVRLFCARYVKCDSNTEQDAVLWSGSYWMLKKGVAMAAVPGTSNHGWGLSVDVLLTRNGKEKKWLLENALRFGFCWEYESEPWHLTYFAGDAPVSEWSARSFERATLGRWLVQPKDNAFTATRIITRAAELKKGDALFVSPNDRGPGVSINELDQLPFPPAALLTELETDQLPPGLFSADIPIYGVENALKALVDIAYFSRAQFHGKVIGVTGSVGKTSTCSMLARALASLNARVYSKNYGNLRGGIARTLRLAPHDADYYVFEVAMGGVDTGATLVRPDVAIVTSIGPGHLEKHRTPSNVAKKKARIFKGVADGGAAVICRDAGYADVLIEAANEQCLRVLTYGEHPDADIRLTQWNEPLRTAHIQTPRGGLTLTMEPEGLHWVQNAMACIASAIALDTDHEPMLKSLSSFKPLKGRGATYTLRHDEGTVLLCDESYNANPLSMEAAIRSARSAFMKSGYKRLILVLGDMLELGEDEVRYHTELLQVIDDNRPHVLVLCGPLMAHLSQLMAQCKQSFTTATFDTVDAVIEWANVNVRPGDMLMVKSSNGTGLHRLVENILNNSRQ